MNNSREAGSYKIEYALINNKKLKVTKIIGEGAYSYVFHCYDTDSKIEYALKQIRTGDKMYENITRNELFALRKMVDADYIVKFYGHLNHASGFDLILLEYCPMTLFEIIQQRGGCIFEDWEVVKTFGQITKGIHNMHSFAPPLINFDLKIENVLISTSGEVRLCDFGSVRNGPIIPEKGWSHKKRCEIEEELAKITTPHCRSPEMIDLYLNYEIGTKSDIWALGCILYFLIYFKYPFEDGARLAILNTRFKLQSSSSFITEKVHPIIRSIFVLNPQQRPSAQDLFQQIVTISKEHKIHIYGPIFADKVKENLSKFESHGMVEQMASKASHFLASLKEAGSKIKTHMIAQVSKKHSSKTIVHFTSRIMIVPCPSSSHNESSTSDQFSFISAEKLANYLNSNFQSCYLIVNLINSAFYPISIFMDSVVTFKMSLDEIPNLFELLSFIERCIKFLLSRSDKVLVVHCEDGGYLSHYFSCLLLLYSGVSIRFEEVFNKIISKNHNYKISKLHNSYMRLAKYIEVIFKNPGIVLNDDPLLLDSIVIVPVILCNSTQTCLRPFVTISVDDSLIFSSIKDSESIREYNKNDHQVEIFLNRSVIGNINVTLYHISRVNSKLAQKKIFSFSFHSGFVYPSNSFTLSGSELDIPSPVLCKSIKNVTVNLKMRSYVNIGVSVSNNSFKASLTPATPTACFKSLLEASKFTQYHSSPFHLRVKDKDKLQFKSMPNALEIDDELFSETFHPPSNENDTKKITKNSNNNDDVISQVSSPRPQKPPRPNYVKSQKTIDFVQPHSQNDIFDVLIPNLYNSCETPKLDSNLLLDSFPDSYFFGSPIEENPTLNPFSSTNDSLFAYQFDPPTEVFSGNPETQQHILSDINETSCYNTTLNQSSLLQNNDLLDFNNSKPPSEPKLLIQSSFSNLSLDKNDQKPKPTTVKTPSNTTFEWNANGGVTPLSFFSKPSTKVSASKSTSCTVGTSFQQNFDLFDDILSEHHGFGPDSHSKNREPDTKTTLNDVIKRQENLLVQDPVAKAIKTWSDGKRKNIRALLSSLHLILWPTDKWSPITIHELNNPENVKKIYKKACLCVHPDKHVGSPHEDLAKGIFTILSEGWSAFESSGSKIYN